MSCWPVLPAGRYLGRVEQGLVRADRSVVVPVGSQGVIDVPLNAARLQLSAVGTLARAAVRPVVGAVRAALATASKEGPEPVLGAP